MIIAYFLLKYLFLQVIYGPILVLTVPVPGHCLLFTLKPVFASYIWANFGSDCTSSWSLLTFYFKYLFLQVIYGPILVLTVPVPGHCLLFTLKPVLASYIWANFGSDCTSSWSLLTFYFKYLFLQVIYGPILVLTVQVHGHCLLFTLNTCFCKLYMGQFWF